MTSEQTHGARGPAATHATGTGSPVVPLAPVLAAFLVTILFAGPAAAVTGPAWSFPLAMTVSELEEACGPGRDWLDMWMSADLGYDAAVDGISGQLDIGIDVWIRTPDSLAGNARVSKATGSGIRCTGVDIDVYSPIDGSSRHVPEKDLAWQGALDSGNGVITLDSAHYSAVIPGLRVGDRLRIVWHREWVRSHGMPVVNLHGPGGGPAHAAIRVQVPTGQRLAYSVVGSAELVDKVMHRTGNGQGGDFGSWDFRDAPRGSGDARDDDGILTLVTHVAVDDSLLTATTFAAAPDWERAARGYRERVEPLLAPSPELTALARGLVEGRVSKRDRIAALYEHVQTTTRYLGLFSGEGGIIPALADETHRLGYGDCKGLATYLIALCRAVDIPAWPVLLLADEDARLAVDVPNTAQFNHFITWADDGQGGCWLDPTLEDIPAGVVTALDADKPVLMTRPGSEGLCRIPRDVWDPGCRFVRVDGLVDATLRLQATVTLSAAGPGGRVLSTRLEHLDGKRRDTVVRDLLLSPGLRLASVRTVAADSTDTLPTWRRECRTTAALPSGAGTLFVPSEIAFLPELHDRAEDAAGIADPAARPDRREAWRLLLPGGWALSAPDSFTVSGPGLRWLRVVRQEGNTIVLRREVDWDDVDLPDDQHDAAVKTLGEAIARERAPLLLKGR